MIDNIRIESILILPTMRFITFNVNGIRSLYTKSKDGKKLVGSSKHCLSSLLEEEQPDFLCLQEIKTQNQSDLDELSFYFPYRYTHFATNKKGYSGVALLSRHPPEWVSYGFDLFHEDRIGEYEKFDFVQEGRLICAKFQQFILITVYVPNSKPGLIRIQERVIWENLLRNYLRELEIEFNLPVIVCGDLNVAPEDKDIHRKQPKGTPGASKEERDEFQKLMKDGWLDAYRLLHSDEIQYTYWSNFANSREKNKGWRIDLFLLSSSLQSSLQLCHSLPNYHGSDHCPVLLSLNIST
jgi:exodeoxyribonuclease III